MAAPRRESKVFAVVEQVLVALPRLGTPEMIERLFDAMSAALGAKPARGWRQFVAQVRRSGAAADAAAVLVAALVLLQRAASDDEG